jgi:hypothetical protein
VITATSASSVGETTATLNGALDPNGTRAKAHFEYLTEAEYVAAGNSFSGATPAPAKDIIVDNQVEGKGSSESGSGALRGVSVEKGSFVAGQLIKAKDVLPTGTTINSVEADPAAPGKQILYLSAKALETKAAASFTATGGAAIGSGDITFESDRVKNLTTTSGTFIPGQTITGPGISTNTTIADSFGASELRLSRPATTTTKISITAASGQPLATEVEGLAPQTKYLMRLVAERTNGSEQVFGPVTAFYTLSSNPTFEDCPANEAFRSGAFAPFGHPSDALPDCRAYEQASPVNKNGGDVLGEVHFSKAADDGSSVTFGSSFGVPGAEGAQERPFYLATRGGEGGWNTTGLMPPASAGEKAQPLAGWSPNFENAYAIASRPKEALNEVLKQALFELHRDGTPPTQITPFAFQPPIGLGASYFAGTSSDMDTVVTESFGRLPPAPGQPSISLASPGNYNVYAWDRTTEELHLTSVMNTQDETEKQLPKGGIAGPYDWANASKGTRLGGASSSYYLRGEHAVSADGSVFFTAAGSGQLYQRLNPTAVQSEPGPNGYVEDGHCFEPAKACTIHISASEKTNGGPSQNGPDPAGPQPAAFQAASADGSVSYFTSSEKLTNDANTGPEQPPAQIGVADLSDPDPNATKDESFLPTHAKSLATSPDGEYLYWVDPSKNSIGRAKLNPDGSHGTIEDDFIVPAPTTYEPDPEGHPGVTEETPSVPQYVAVGPCAEGGECVYWTNRGPLDKFQSPIENAGTIGRATLSDGALGSPDPEFISKVSDPRGLALHQEYIYWGTALPVPFPPPATPARAISRASLDGNSVDMTFFRTGNYIPNALALGPAHIYYSVKYEGNDVNAIRRISYDGHGENEQNASAEVFVGNDSIRGLTVTEGRIYWTSVSESGLGRLKESAFLNGNCPSNPDCEQRYLSSDGTPFGLTNDGLRLFWATNGDAPTNPGNDLYRHTLGGADGCTQPSGCLEDLVSDAADPNGAEVRGVVGASVDGSYLYFVANGDLDSTGPAKRGNCRGSGPQDWSGHCPLYLWHEGEIQAVGILQPGAGSPDGLDWAPTPRGLFGQASFVEKTSFVSPDGLTLVFRSQVNQTSGETEDKPQFYRYQFGEGVSCLTCAPSGFGNGKVQLQTARVGDGGLAASFSYAVESHHLADGGNRFFFETTAALVSADINGLGGCKDLNGQNRAFSCQDVYEWEAPGSGTCTEGGPAYSPANHGCLYLISTGRSKYPVLFVDASASGDDVFFLTRDQLVGQDTDSLQDVYDARVNGGLASQNQPPAIPCENEGCKNEAGSPLQFTPPPQISGPGNPPIKRKQCKPKKGKKRCAKHRKHQKRNRPATNHHGGRR